MELSSIENSWETLPFRMGWRTKKLRGEREEREGVMEEESQVFVEEDEWETRTPPLNKIL